MIHSTSSHWWRVAGWLVAWLTSFAGLIAMAWILWKTSQGHPRGPANALFMGLLTYAAITIRSSGGVGFLLFKSDRRHLLKTMLAWWTCWLTLIWFEGTPLVNLFERLFALGLVLLATILDLYLLFKIRNLPIK